MSILVIDDSPDSRLLMHGLLRDAGYRDILTARSAQEAFKHLGIGSNEANPCPIDVILMDISMPELDGLDACRRIKTEERLKDIPVVMVTVREKARFLPKAFEAGATDYIKKPVERVELLARVRAALRLKRATDARKHWEQELTQTVMSMTRTLQSLQTILKLLPVCPTCQTVHNDGRFQSKLSEHLASHPNARLNYRRCATCSTNPR